MKTILIAFIAGVTFGLGMIFSGMYNPYKVLNFFDIAGTWDPSLIFVMGGALMMTLVGYQLTFRRQKPLFAERFNLPTNKDIDKKLIIGAAIFGIGWGFIGFCPGSAIPLLGTGNFEVLIYITAMLAGMVITRRVMLYLETRSNF